LIEHSLEQSFGRSRRNTSLAELKHLSALASDLDAHAYDFRADEVDVRHEQAQKSR
jgi:hypothetical protein